MEQKKPLLQRILQSREISLVIVIAFLMIVLAITTDTFMTQQNLYNFLRQVTIIIVASSGITFIMSTGGMDMSIGEILTLSGIIGTLLFPRIGTFPGIIISILLAGFLSSINAFLVNEMGLPPFIITLAMMNVFKGISLVITKGYPVTLESPFIYKVGQLGFEKFFNFPILPVAILIAVPIGYFIMNKTVLGNHIKAIGGNPVAARLSGLNVERLRIYAYLIGGFFMGFAGMLTVGRLNAGNPTAAGTTNFDAMSATIIGGTSMAGGQGSVLGTMLGAALMQIIKTGLILLQVNMYWQTIVIGIVLLAVCSLDALTQRVTLSLSK